MRRLAPLLLLALVAGAYAPAIHDRFAGIYLAPASQAESTPGHAPPMVALGADRAAMHHVRPVVDGFHALEHFVLRDDLRGYHAASIALHLLVVLLIVTVARRVGIATMPAWLGAAAFGLHPGIADTVHRIDARPELLGTLVALTTIAAWLATTDAATQPRARRAAMPLLALGAAAASLADASTVALFLPLGWLVPTRHDGRRSGLASLLALLSGGIAGALASVSLGRSHPRVEVTEALARLPQVWFDGLALVAQPVTDPIPSVAEHYARLDVTVIFPAIAVSVVAVLGVVVAARARAYRTAWLLTTYLTALVPLAWRGGDYALDGWGRWFYASTAMACLGIAAGLDRLQASVPARRLARVQWATAIAVLGVLGASTFLGGSAFRNDRSMAIAEMTDHSDYSMSAAHYADVCLVLEDLPCAVPLSVRAVKLGPERAENWSRLAGAFLRAGWSRKGFLCAHRAQALAPDNALAGYLLAVESLHAHHYDEAAHQLLEAMYTAPQLAGPDETLMITMRREGTEASFARAVRARLRDPRYAALAARIEPRLPRR